MSTSQKVAAAGCYLMGLLCWFIGAGDDVVTTWMASAVIITAMSCRD